VWTQCHGPPGNDIRPDFKSLRGPLGAVAISPPCTTEFSNRPLRRNDDLVYCLLFFWIFMRFMLLGSAAVMVNLRFL